MSKVKVYSLRSKIMALLMVPIVVSCVLIALQMLKPQVNDQALQVYDGSKVAVDWDRKR